MASRLRRPGLPGGASYLRMPPEARSPPPRGSDDNVRLFASVAYLRTTLHSRLSRMRILGPLTRALPEKPHTAFPIGPSIRPSVNLTHFGARVVFFISAVSGGYTTCRRFVFHNFA